MGKIEGFGKLIGEMFIFSKGYFYEYMVKLFNKIFFLIVLYFQNV